ncbi:hypothetical protein ACLOJK_037807 [Asimina triloba]
MFGRPTSISLSLSLINLPSESYFGSWSPLFYYNAFHRSALLCSSLLCRRHERHSKDKEFLPSFLPSTCKSDAQIQKRWRLEFVVSLRKAKHDEKREVGKGHSYKSSLAWVH